MGQEQRYRGQIQDTTGYLRAYAYGIPAIIFLDIFMCLMQLEGKKIIVMLCSIGVLFINFMGDIANIFYFHKGIIGMGHLNSILKNGAPSLGITKKKRILVGLFIEEISKNILTYGFNENHKSSIIVKLAVTDNSIVLGIKDNCTYFDPTHYYECVKDEKDGVEGFGIRMLMRLSKSVSYTNSFSLNNLRVEV